MNPILKSDSYKFTHWKQYPPKTTKVYSYFESRGGDWNETLFFGLQYIIKKHLSRRITHADVLQAMDLCTAHFGNDKLFNQAGWYHLIKDHEGKWPVEIKAVPEGTLVSTHNVLVTVENTCPECYWVTNFLETLLVQVWYPMTVATLSYEMKKRILVSLEKTGDPSLIDFKLHDFGCRGVSSMESAEIGGLAHLVNFLGTDTFPALAAAQDYYDEPMAGFSIPAAEHSTIISWGENQEVDAYRNMITQFPEGLVAVVSDSYDITDACDKIWGYHLKDEVLARNGTVIIRPDSGVPHKIVPEIFDILGKRFGYTVNAKLYKELPPQIAVIQGDGMDYEECGRILQAMEKSGWSSNQLAFGMGGGLLQKLHRDTQECAFKCSYVEVDGESRAVSKDPATDHGKKSKAGRLKLVKSLDGFGFVTRDGNHGQRDCLQTVYLDGEITNTASLSEIRGRVGK